EPAIVVCDAELTRQVFVDDRTYDKGGPMFENARTFSGNGLVTTLHDTHRRQRRLAQVAFQRLRLPGYAQTMVGQIAKLADTWRDGQVIDVLAELMKLSSSALVETIFCDTLQDTDYQALHDNIALLVNGLLREMVTPAKLKGLPGFSSRTFRRA